MKTVYISFNLKSINCSTNDMSTYEQDYKLVYKPLIQFLYSHEDFPFSFSLNGNLLYYFRNRKTEILSILKVLIERKQIEIIGGGFYDPILPLIFPADRNGQIDLLSTEIRHLLGKRPRGITIHSDVWDPNIISTVHTCGIEYILLDSSVIQEDKQLYLPLVVSDLGNSVDIYPCYSNLKPTIDTLPEDFIKNILSCVQKVEEDNPIFENKTDRIINFNLDHDDLYNLIKDQWFTKLYHYLNGVDNVKLTTINNFRKDCKFKVQSYIPSGINNRITKYIPYPFKESSIKKTKRYTIFDYMETYYLSANLYSRMIYVSILVNQYRGDKQKKKAARDLLWKAQTGNSLVWCDSDITKNYQNRQEAYRNLMKAEHICREDSKIKSIVTRYDYNNDGLNEYVCNMTGFSALISLIGGMVSSLELPSNFGNYADNMSRLLPFDGATDNYRRGHFVDHFFTEKQLREYINNKKPNCIDRLPNITYNENTFKQASNYIRLDADTVIDVDTPVHIEKKYSVSDNGMLVVYIIRNTSDKKIKINFGVEFNFACLKYKGKDINYYKLEVVAEDEKYYINDDANLVSDDGTEERTYKNLVNNMSSFRVNDLESDWSFTYVPNEKCRFCCNTIEFKRPDSKGVNHKVEKTFVATAIWTLEIDPGLETEKNISFSISQPKNLRK